MIRKMVLDTITAAGSDGSAAGTFTTREPITGKVLGVHIDYSTGQAATTDVTIATTGTPVVTLLTITDNKTDAWFYPRHQVCGSTGTALTVGSAALLLEESTDSTSIAADPVAIDDYVKVTVAQADADETVQVTLVVEV